MKRDLVYKLLLFISIILILLFIVFVYIDYSKYDSLTFSAPFSAYVLIRLLEFVLPSIILLILALLFKRKR